MSGIDSKKKERTAFSGARRVWKNAVFVLCCVLSLALVLSGCGSLALPGSSGANNAKGAGGKTDAELLTAGVITLPSGEEVEILASASADPVLSEVREEEEDGVKQASMHVFAMDTEMEIRAYGENCAEAVRAAGEEIGRIDRLLSVGRADSEIAVLNKEGSAEVSAMTADLLRRAVQIGAMTEHSFDMTVFPLMSIWGFTTGDFSVPDPELIQAILPFLGDEKVSIGPADGEASVAVCLESGTMIDLGGIAKGYTSARLMEIFAEHGVDAGLISLGGNVQTYRSKPDGSDWRVGIQDPDGTENYLGIVTLHDKAVVTSGGYERYFEEDGVRYHHILDPADGYPAESGLKSVTIVSPDGTLADGLSTALFVMGRERAETLWKAHSQEFDMILETEDGTLYVSEGLADCFTSEHEIKMIHI